jgi:hypothetical protein
VLFDVEALPTAAGGLAGAEGSLRMMIRGDAESVGQAMALIHAIQGEAAIG